MITHQLRLYPTKSQKLLIDKQLEIHRKLYNRCLERKIREYKETGKSSSCFDLIKTEIKPDKGLSNYSAMQQTVRRLDKSYSSFFRKNSKFPRFKGENRFRTIEYAKYGDGHKIKNGKFYMQYVGNIKCIIHVALENIRHCSVTKHGDTYLLNVTCDNDKSVCFSEKTVGIDFGIKSTITTSDGIHFETPKFDRANKELKKLQRKKNWKAYSKTKWKISNRRKDFNHKLSRKIVNQYDIICLEDLQIEDILSFRNVNRKLYDIGICQLKQFICYKAENAGKTIILVDPSYTSQTCPNCGNIKEKSLKERVHSCECGLICDRDVAAANQILRLGLQSLGRSLEAH